MRNERHFMRGKNTRGQILHYGWGQCSPWPMTRLGSDHRGRNLQWIWEKRAHSAVHPSGLTRVTRSCWETAQARSCSPYKTPRVLQAFPSTLRKHRELSFCVRNYGSNPTEEQRLPKTKYRIQAKSHPFKDLHLTWLWDIYASQHRYGMRFHLD